MIKIMLIKNNKPTIQRSIYIFLYLDLMLVLINKNFYSMEVVDLKYKQIAIQVSRM